MKANDTYERWLAERRHLSRDELHRELERVDIDKLDRWAFGVIGDEVVKLSPKDLTIVHKADLENAEHQASRFVTGLKGWAKRVSLSEPVEVSVSRRGEFVLEDGHHRYLAARLSGRKLKAKITVKGKPIEELLSRSHATRKKAAQLDGEIAAFMRKR